MLRYPKVLLLSNDHMQTETLQELLDRHVLLTPVHQLSELPRLLEHDSYDALFYTASSNSGAWNAALEEVLKIAPDMPVIILSSSAEERAWIEALEAGAFDLLAPPLQESTLLAVLEQASASREARAARSLVPLLN